MRIDRLLLLALALGVAGCPAQDVGPPRVVATVDGPPKARLVAQMRLARSSSDPYAVIRHPSWLMYIKVDSVPPIDEQVGWAPDAPNDLKGWQLRAKPHEWVAYRSPGKSTYWVIRWLALHGCSTTMDELDDAHQPSIEESASQLVLCAPEVVFKVKPATAVRILEEQSGGVFAREPELTLRDGVLHLQDSWLDAVEWLAPPQRAEVTQDLLTCFRTCPREGNDNAWFLGRAAALADWSKPETARWASEWAALAPRSTYDGAFYARLFRGAARLDGAHAAEVACRAIAERLSNVKGMTDADGGLYPMPEWTASAFEAIAHAKHRCPATLDVLASWPCNAAYACAGDKVCTAHELAAEVGADLARPDAPRAWAPTRLAPLRAALAAALAAGQKPAIRARCGP